MRPGELRQNSDPFCSGIPALEGRAAQRMDWGKATGALAWGMPECRMTSSSSETTRRPALSSTDRFVGEREVAHEDIPLGKAVLVWSAQSKDVVPWEASSIMLSLLCPPPVSELQSLTH